MFRPKVPNDNNKKHLIFSFVSLLIPVFIDFPHVLFAQEVFGEIKEFWNSEMGDLDRGVCPRSGWKWTPQNRHGNTDTKLGFLPTFEIISSVWLEGVSV